MNWVAGCPADDAACGFKRGMAVLLYDASGDYDTFTITDVQSNVLHVQADRRHVDVHRLPAGHHIDCSTRQHRLLPETRRVGRHLSVDGARRRHRGRCAGRGQPGGAGVRLLRRSAASAVDQIAGRSGWPVDHLRPGAAGASATDSDRRLSRWRKLHVPGRPVERASRCRDWRCSTPAAAPPRSSS